MILKNDAYDLVIDECNKQILLWTAICFEDVERRIPSWTDFQILMKNQTPSWYLPSDNSIAFIHQLQKFKQFIRQISNDKCFFKY